MSCLMCNDTGHIALGSIPKTACPMCGLRDAEARIAVLEAENAKLRKALEAVKMLGDADYQVPYKDFRQAFGKVYIIVRDTLFPKEDR